MCEMAQSALRPQKHIKPDIRWIRKKAKAALFGRQRPIGRVRHELPILKHHRRDGEGRRHGGDVGRWTANNIQGFCWDG